jgi:hypothetical protein
MSFNHVVCGEFIYGSDNTLSDARTEKLARTLSPNTFRQRSDA